MPNRFDFASHLAALLQSEVAVLGPRSLDCADAAELLNSIDDIAAYAPVIAAPAYCAAIETLAAIPLLMRGRFRLIRLRLLRGYLNSIQADVRMRLAIRAEEMALLGRWNPYLALRFLLHRSDAQVALLTALGFLFVLRIPVKFEAACDSMARLLGNARAD
jgi:non-ribosomal peptide synthetase component F